MNVLVVAAHPDDDVIGMGGTLVQHMVAGDSIWVIYLTDGSRGIPGRDPEEVAQIRHAEAIAAAGVLAGDDDYARQSLLFWEQADSQLAVTDALIDRMEDFLRSYEPDVVYTTHDQDAHSDHRAAANIVRQAAARLEDPPVCWMYEIWTPLQRVDRSVQLTPDQTSIKVAAISAHTTQQALTDYASAAYALNNYRSIMLGKGPGFAEAFQRLSHKGAPMRIAICLFTWSPSIDHPRSLYAQRTLQAALEKLDPGPGNEIAWHIADDGSDPAHVQALFGLCMQRGIMPTWTNSERGGYGRSYNLATQALHGQADYLLCLEDDWELSRALDLGPLVAAMEEKHPNHEPIGCIRLGYLGYTARLDNHLITRAGQQFMYFDPSSTEPHIFAGHPRLEAAWWQRDVGAWPEGMPAGATEFEVAHREAARRGVVWPLDLTRTWGDLFPHIGSEGVGSVIPG